MIYYRRYIGAYQKRTTRLSMRDHGAYGLMLDFYYAEEQPLPLEIEDIYDICKARTPDDRKSVQKVLKLHFEKGADGYHNARADAEIAASRQARKNGQGGGRPPRKGKTGDETEDETETVTGDGTGHETRQVTETVTGTGHPSSFNHSAVQPSSRSAPQPSPDSRQPLSAHPPADRAHGKDPYPSEFEATWRAYPARHGSNPKRDALKAWNARLKAGATAEEMRAGVDRYAAHIRTAAKEGTEFVMQAVRFFGPSEHFRDTWPTTAVSTNGLRQAAIDEAERRIFGGDKPERDITDEAR